MNFDNLPPVARGHHCTLATVRAFGFRRWLVVLMLTPFVGVVSALSGE